MTLKQFKELLITFHDWSCTGHDVFSDKEHPWMHSNYNRKQEDIEKLGNFIEVLGLYDDYNDEFTFEWAKTLPSIVENDSEYLVFQKDGGLKISVYRITKQIFYNHYCVNDGNNTNNNLIKTKGDFRWLLKRIGI